MPGQAVCDKALLYMEHMHSNIVSENKMNSQIGKQNPQASSCSQKMRYNS